MDTPTCVIFFNDNGTWKAVHDETAENCVHAGSGPRQKRIRRIIVQHKSLDKVKTLVQKHFIPLKPGEAWHGPAQHIYGLNRQGQITANHFAAFAGTPQDEDEQA